MTGFALDEPFHGPRCQRAVGSIASARADPSTLAWTPGQPPLRGRGIGHSRAPTRIAHPLNIGLNLLFSLS
jgi:hypothetical protein